MSDSYVHDSIVRHTESDHGFHATEVDSCGDRPRPFDGRADPSATLAGGLLGVLAELLRPIYVAWMVAAFPIGWTISLVVMAAMFYGLFTPIGLFFRLIGRDSMELQASLWIIFKF